MSAMNPCFTCFDMCVCVWGGGQVDGIWGCGLSVRKVLIQSEDFCLNKWSMCESGGGVGGGGVLCQLLVVFCPHLQLLTVCCPHVVLFVLRLSEPLPFMHLDLCLWNSSEIALPETKEVRHFFPRACSLVAPSAFLIRSLRGKNAKRLFEKQMKQKKIQKDLTRREVMSEKPGEKLSFNSPPS